MATKNLDFYWVCPYCESSIWYDVSECDSCGAKRTADCVFYDLSGNEVTYETMLNQLNTEYGVSSSDASTAEDVTVPIAVADSAETGLLTDILGFATGFAVGSSFRGFRHRHMSTRPPMPSRRICVHHVPPHHPPQHPNHIHRPRPSTRPAAGLFGARPPVRKPPGHRVAPPRPAPVSSRPMSGHTAPKFGFGSRPVGGRPVGGRPVGGRPVGGRPVGGRPAMGRPMGGRTNMGRPSGGPRGGRMGGPGKGRR